MRIVIVTVRVPFVNGGAENLAEGLRDALLNAGHETEIVAIPFKWYPAERILDQMLACRLLDLTESSRVPVDRVIGLKFPAYLVPQPNKVLWLLHQHRQAYDQWGHDSCDLDKAANGLQVRTAIRRADDCHIPDARAVYTIAANVSHRLRVFNGIESTPLYHPPRNAETFCGERPESYLFYPSRLSDSKRQQLVLQALAQTREKVQVRFAGTADRPAYEQRLQRMARRLGVRHRVRWLGWIDEGEKRRQYARALAVVFPPRDEDYGYITLEAMLSSKPVITCRDAGGPLEFVQHEQTGVVAEATPEALAAAFDQAWQQRDRMQQYGEAGRRRYSRWTSPGLTWSASSRPESVSPNMKINWFSPLRPSRTAIADYAAHALAALSARSEVVIWTDQAQWDPQIEAWGEVRRYRATPCWHDLNRADATLYNIGNHVDFHGPLWEVSRRLAGIVILHDTHLQHLFASLYKRVWKRPDDYRAAMAHHYGRAGAEATDTYFAGGMSTEQLAERFPLTALATQHAWGAVVHVPDAVETLAREQHCPVLYAPLPYAAPREGAGDAAAVGAARADAPPYRLIVFGYLGPNRRLDAILQALSALPRREAFHLHVYGKLDKPEQWRQRIADCGLARLVTLHGFVSEQELDQALASAHLAINLRYPSMGEASWTQLRLWSHGLPSLVTQTGWYASLPEEAVEFVRCDREITDIQRHLEDFQRYPDRFAHKGQAGYRILRRDHAPEAYADALLDYARGLEPHRGRVTARQLVTRTGAILREWVGHDEPAPALDNIAQEIRRFAA